MPQVKKATFLLYGSSREHLGLLHFILGTYLTETCRQIKERLRRTKMIKGLEGLVYGIVSNAGGRAHPGKHN